MPISVDVLKGLSEDLCFNTVRKPVSLTTIVINFLMNNYGLAYTPNEMVNFFKLNILVDFPLTKRYVYNVCWKLSKDKGSMIFKKGSYFYYEKKGGRK